MCRTFLGIKLAVNNSFDRHGCHLPTGRFDVRCFAWIAELTAVVHLLLSVQHMNMMSLIMEEQGCGQTHSMAYARRGWTRVEYLKHSRSAEQNPLLR